MSSQPTQRHPLNAAGDFYVAAGMCIACAAPERAAPDLMAHDSGTYHCYFERQPGTNEELTQAIDAVVVGCCGAVRYGGTDATVLRQLAESGVSEACDNARFLGESPLESS